MQKHLSVFLEFIVQESLAMGLRRWVVTPLPPTRPSLLALTFNSFPISVSLSVKGDLGQVSSS